MRTRTRELEVAAGVLFLAATLVSQHARAGSTVSLQRDVVDIPPSPQAREVLVRGNMSAVNLREIAPGLSLGRLSSDEIAALAGRSGVDLQILPDLHLTTDVAIPIINVPAVETQGLTGKGVVVGVVDSGFDVTHAELRDPTGATRFTWLLDYSRRTRGKYPDLETRFQDPQCLERTPDGHASDGGSCDSDARCSSASFPCAMSYGAVFSGDDINALLAAAPTPPEPLPTDEEGHGTHAAGIAGGTRLATSPYRGVATEAKLIGVKVVRAGELGPAAVLQGVRFIFDRADADHVPAAVNLSLTSDFVPHDGSDGFGPAVATLARGPGHIVVAAAGNSGDPGAASHQTVSVAPGESVRVNMVPFQNLTKRQVGVIVGPHPGSDIRVGCDTPDGTWVTPIGRGRSRSGVVGDSIANVIFNPKDAQGRLPATSTSALVLMQGTLAVGEPYALRIEGSGTADLWIVGGYFENGVREQTIGSPALHPGVISVGASVTRIGLRTINNEDLVLQAAIYDKGGLVRLPTTTPPVSGQIGAFSAAGPGPEGVIKPDLIAPGVIVISAIPSQRDPATSVFYGTGLCPPRVDGSHSTDPQCLLTDPTHGAATGTSFAAPFVTGAAAILLEVDPSLTQEAARAALQAGVHPLRTPARFPESASVGELDVAGAVDVVRRGLTAPPTTPTRPVTATSWITVGSHYVPADGTRPLEVYFHLRGPSGEPADGFDRNHFTSFIEGPGYQGEPQRLERLAPGLWSGSFDVPATLATRSITVHATYDGGDVAAPITLPVALDPWKASYPASAAGASCATSAERPADRSTLVLLLLSIGLVLTRRLARP